ncbi:MAG TPA: site-specific recombinase [Streptosporangiaceae bacterium]|jgi:integrase/recombinase XerD
MAAYQLPAGPAPEPTPAVPPPVEYAVAVEEYLARAPLGPASRRVYRISLAGWAWPLAGRPVPAGPARRRAAPPVLPLAVLDDAATGGRIAAAVAERARLADARTVNRELSALRSAIGWWQEQRWITGDPTRGLRHARRPPASRGALTADQVDSVFRLPAGLREHVLWRMLYDSGGHTGDVLALDADRLDLARHQVWPRPGSTAMAGGVPLHWREGTSQLLRWLLAGRTYGPVFVTERKARAAAAPADICPVTGQARMSYRRAAEIFTAATRPLDPARRGWTLHQLRAAGLNRG